MVFWYWYVLSASALSFFGYITLDAILTSVLAIIVHLLFHFAGSKTRTIQKLKVIVVAMAAMMLLWHESYLPPVSTLVSFLTDPQTRPSTEYLLEFIRQSLNMSMLLAGSILFAVTMAVSRKKPLLLTLCVYFILTAAWITQPSQNLAAMASASPESFYANERSRRVEFRTPDKDSPPFDILILHICSLSWQDLKDADANLIPFFSKFDYVFTNFSAACSYSGPAALRVLKAPCGQLPHPLLYTDAPDGCYLMDNLRNDGFTPYTMFSHDGKYADFRVNVQKYGHAPAPMDLSGLPVAYRMFDGDTMYADNAALLKFWKARIDSAAPRAALYYNTANLHIGTHEPGVARGPDDVASYRQRLSTMTAQLEEFFSEIEKSGRNAVVIFVPEHGAALSGTKMQAKDVREIPLPGIATVPVAVKIIGKSFYSDSGKPQVITKPTSMLALGWLLADFLRNNPYTPDARKPETVAAEIPGTEFMAENANAAVMRVGLGYIYNQKGQKWAPLPASAGMPPGVLPSPQDFKLPAR